MFTATSQINIKAEKLTLLFDGVRNGLPIQYACDKAGIPVYFYYKWLKLYNEFISQKEQDGDVFNDIEELEPKPIYNKDKEICGYTFTPISLLENIKKGYAEWVEEKHNRINDGDGNWQSQSWLLERRVKQEYSKEETTTQSNKTAEPIKIVYVDPNKEKTRIEKLEQEVKDAIN